MRIKQKPEDFVVREAYRFDETRRGEYYVYLMDKQKLSTFDAVERIARALSLETRDISFCGLKDKQGRTEQIIAIRGRRADMQAPDLRLKFLGRTGAPLSAANLTANRFVVTVRDLTIEETERVPASVEEVRRLGVVNYFDSQRFGGVKHGQGFLAKDLAFGRVEHALRGWLAKPSALDRTEDARVKAFWHRHWGEWNARPPFRRMVHYRPVLDRLRRNPDDWVGAFRAIDKRVRAMMVFEYQSYLWNEAVRRYLLGRLGADGHLAVRYQAGVHLFPRAVRDQARAEALAGVAFPLIGSDTTFDDPEIEKAVQDTLAKEHVTLAQLGLEAIPDMGFKHEPRELIVKPGRLTVVDPRPDELNRGRLKVTLAFTLPPGAYATLVVRRTLWFAEADVVAPGGPLPRPAPGFIPQETLERLQSISSRAMTSRRRPARPGHGIAVVDTGRLADADVPEDLRRSRRPSPRRRPAPPPKAEAGAEPKRPGSKHGPARDAEPRRPSSKGAPAKGKRPAGKGRTAKAGAGKRSAAKGGRGKGAPKRGSGRGKGAPKRGSGRGKPKS